MECSNCKNKIEGNPKFCPNCGKKHEALEIPEDIGEQIIERLENNIKILEIKAKEEKEKLYPYPHCNKEMTIEQLKSNNQKRY